MGFDDYTGGGTREAPLCMLSIVVQSYKSQVSF